jgi:hypothetical protein
MLEIGSVVEEGGFGFVARGGFGRVFILVWAFEVGVWGVHSVMGVVNELEEMQGS